MITIILILTVLYFLLSYGAYLQSEKRCRTEEDKKALKAFKGKLYTNWIYYALFIGALRARIKQVKDLEINQIDKTYPGDLNEATIRKFSSGFSGLEKRGAMIFAQYIVNPRED